jgi:hypothetical protein
MPSVASPAALRSAPPAATAPVAVAPGLAIGGRALVVINDRVILCERGIRTFETATRNTLDVSAVPVLKAETHLPVLVDPSHAAGRAALVAPLALAAVAAGADGLLVEVHPEPAAARSDGAQSLDLAAFAALMDGVRAVAAAVGRTVFAPPAAPASPHAAPPAARPAARGGSATVRVAARPA